MTQYRSSRPNRMSGTLFTYYRHPTYWLYWRHLATSLPVFCCESWRKALQDQQWSCRKKLGTDHGHPCRSCQGPATSKFGFPAIGRDHQHHVEPFPVTLSTPSAPLYPSIALETSAAMAENNPQPVANISRTTRPMSEALLNEKV